MRDSSDNNERARYRTAFGAALDAQLRKRGLRQTDLADRLGVSRQMVNKVVRGYGITASSVNRIGEALAVTPAESKTLHYWAATDQGFEVTPPPDLVDEPPPAKKKSSRRRSKKK